MTLFLVNQILVLGTLPWKPAKSSMSNILRFFLDLTLDMAT